jgi:hypothetical protein
MKTLLSIILFFLFAGCNDNSKIDTIQLASENSIIVTLKLVDSLGNIRVTLPKRYDTSFTWTDHSDCGKPCDKIKYRFQPKMLKISKESGWIWPEQPKDSVEKFTIVHSGYFPFHDDTDSNFIFKVHQRRKSDMVKNSDTYKIKSDTVEIIGDRYFSIVVIELFDSTKSQYSKKVLAATTIKSNPIEFRFELLTKQNNKQTTDFVNNSMYFVRTIRISNGK